MDFLSLKKARPSVGRACLRNRLRHSVCQACQDACPLGAIRLNNGSADIDADSCIGCARCLFVCPASAIENLAPPQRAYRDSALVAPLSLIPPTTEELRLWHSQHHIRSVEIHPDEHHGWLVSIAELNRHLDLVGETMWTLAPPPQNNINAGRRRWLQINRVTAGTKAVSPAAASPTATLAIIMDTNSCYLCGACAKICPQQAITLSEQELTLDPHRCNGCKACENVCFPKAIEVKLSATALLTNYAVFKATCSSCQQTFASWREDVDRCHICKRHTYGMREA
ncbi:4Fe-4S binding protein [Hafnia alvei]|uniref:4Fe-4S dicluster domain-containing protein n=1 Tax=Hafnia alvei TaxID=569 RepID=A0A1C6Z6U6_HAFAL|nr:4Fe-4S binding protein [Hafnia alvei]NLS55833.1 4Fe-4S dicluster domain-containing protein [Hafnia alvei]SCM54765.1 4Fe-4S dicluster domain-containing protein [Hafnia alvei]